MKICIKGNEFNPSFISMYSEEKAIADGYTIYEVPTNYKDCVFEDFDDNGFNIEKYNARKQKEENNTKLQELKIWFDWFDKQLNQSLWQDDFTVSHDKYFDKDYATLDELKAQAKIVRNQIRILEGKQ